VSVAHRAAAQPAARWFWHAEVGLATRVTAPSLFLIGLLSYELAFEARSLSPERGTSTV
jgi:hypothetical protein